jgi:hypothetical protein
VDKAKNLNRRKGAEYFESHHIVPRSLGGSNKNDNRVLLTFKEHFICHHLLTKMCEGDSKMKMCYALFNMRRGNKSIKRILSSAQKRISDNSISEYKNRSLNKGKLTVKDKDGKIFHVTKDDPRWISGEVIHISKGLKRNWTQEEVSERYKTRKGRKYSEEESEKRNLTRPEVWNKGKKLSPHTLDTKKKISEANKGRNKPRIECPHCKKVGGIPQMMQWHFDNCKGK